MKALLNNILAKHSGQPVEKVAKDGERDYFMSAIDAKEYGLVDEVMTQRPFAPKAGDKDKGEKNDK